jgi:uncharacterized protein
MNRLGMLVLLGAALMANAQGASFNCGKAATKVEKLICGDAELSKLDEELNTAYKTALQDERQANSIKQAQKLWVKERQKCADVVCVKRAYEVRMPVMVADTPIDMPSMPLAPFTFTQDETLTGQSYIGQRERPICKDLLDYLNHPRSNSLFKPDGTLVREGEKFKSVSWEVLDKELYREGIIAYIDATSANVRTEYMQRYADPEWALQRTVAHPHESVPKPQQAERWLYRLVHLRPYTRNMYDPASKVELPTWFHFGAVEWLGYADGKPLVGNHTKLSGTASSREWITYAGRNYAVGNSTYGDGKGAVPSHLGVDVHELNIDEDGQTFSHFICAYHAKNEQ